ncbi:serine/threonine-protein kinase VRK1-like isoform X2 [Euwallacea fornicatus]|uniref:serine/threonine-protein kinase VRK1-like isoform X2 n=1 Tax=Euwallacea fornicatus TaxID=995702 RepID=UPI00338E71EB
MCTVNTVCTRLLIFREEADDLGQEGTGRCRSRHSTAFIKAGLKKLNQIPKMPPKKKAANGYKFAEPLPKGTLLKDISKKTWKLGHSIGKGGFGEIYCVQEEGSKENDYPYVVKIEPHSNGPLFVEINFYIRFAKAANVASYKGEKGVKSLGMPIYHGSGSHDYNGEKYRFLVMAKFNTDLLKLFTQNGKIFPVDTTFKIALQMLDVLEYIHKCGYVHADLKAANILLNDVKNAHCYLVDYGLASKFTVAKEFKPNPKKAHDGTMEFLSRDAHQGVQTRRGDVEILSYNILQWLGCVLPWEKNLADPKLVQASKEEHMSTPEKMLTACFKNKFYPKAMKELLVYLQTINFNAEPDYEYIKKIFMTGVKEGSGSMSSGLNFSVVPTKKRGNNTQTKTAKLQEYESSEEEDEAPKPKRRGRAKKEPAVENKFADRLIENQQGTVKRILTPHKKIFEGHNSDNELVSHEKKQVNHVVQKRRVNRLSRSVERLADLIPPEGFTEAMKEIWLKKNGKESTKKATKKKVPVATTSRAKQGFASLKNKAKPRPQFHGEVAQADDGSQSD